MLKSPLTYVLKYVVLNFSLIEEIKEKIKLEIVMTFYSIILCKLMISNLSSTSVMLVIEASFNFQKFS